MNPGRPPNLKKTSPEPNLGLRQTSQGQALNQLWVSAATNRLAQGMVYLQGMISFQLYLKMQLVPHGEQLVSIKKTRHLVLLVFTEARVFTFRPLGIRCLVRGRNEDVREGSVRFDLSHGWYMDGSRSLFACNEVLQLAVTV